MILFVTAKSKDAIKVIVQINNGGIAYSKNVLCFCFLFVILRAFWAEDAQED